MPNGKIEKGTIQQTSGLSFIFCSDTNFLMQLSFTHHEVFSLAGKPILLNATFYTFINITDWKLTF